MYNFCTLFDIHYLTRGIALYESLKSHCKDFHLYLFPFCADSERVLRALNLNNTTLIPLKKLEDDDLLRVKPSRTKGEYCWTCTPATLLYVLTHYNVPQCTYLDADIYFFGNPSVLLEENKEASLLLTEHRYTAEFDQSRTSGKYCVQFMKFNNDAPGLVALRWWREACIDWCYNRFEDNKFGDQKYLDDWCERFSGVHVLQHHGGGLAPWNIQQYNIIQSEGKVLVTQRKSNEVANAIFYHFHGLKQLTNGKVDGGPYPLSQNVVNTIYKPYIKHLSSIEDALNSCFPEIKSSGRLQADVSLKTLARNLKRRLKGTYNIYTEKRLTQHG